MRYEMDGEHHRYEMPGIDIENEIDTVARPEMPSLKKKHELRGEEFSKELEVPIVTRLRHSDSLREGI